MRYVVAVTISVILTAVTLMFVGYVSAWEKQWADYGVKLPNAAITAINLAYFIRCFWYVPTALFFGIPLAIAALWPKREKP